MANRRVARCRGERLRGNALALAIALMFAVVAASTRGATADDHVAAFGCDPAQTDRIVRALADEARKADEWGIQWAVIFGASTVAQVGFAVSHVNPLGPDTDNAQVGLFINSTKSMIGFLARIVTPLRVATVSRAQLNALPNDCARYRAAYSALRTTARREKTAFYLGHFGGLALHFIGSGILLARDGKREAIMSFAIGYPVGLLHNYLMPRISWKLSRRVDAPRVTWLATPTFSQDSAGLAVMGTF